jgi:hypothetical protein
MKKLIVLIAFLVLVLTGCETDADVASYNLSKEADMFRIQRRVVFYNGITDSYMLTIEGRCSLGNNDDPGELTVTCKVAEGQFKKHFLGLSDNVTYFVEQLEPVGVGVYRYKVIFKPSTIIPDVELSR